jgi:hypothetical protein
MNSIAPVHLSFNGPFAWPDLPEAPSVFLAPEGRHSGVYLWTAASKQGHIVYYVGETGRAMSTRFTEHYLQHAAGFYHLYSPSEFLEGVKLEVWPGRYDSKHRKSILECVASHSRLAHTITELTNAYRFFLAPFQADARLRQRIEAAISITLRSLPGVPGTFQDEGIRYRPRRPDEAPLFCRLTTTSTVIEFPMSLAV